MLHTLKFKLILAGYLILVVLIPTTSYLLSQRSKSSEGVQDTSPVTSAKPSPRPTPIDFDNLNQDSNPQTGTVSNLSFGPTLNLTISLEGRAKNNQSGKVFVGIASGQVSQNPKYLLTFTLDFPSSGVYKGLSLAGLEIGTTYTAFIKGPSHIATSSAFTVNPTETNLNQGVALSMLAGDLNEDNRVDSGDYQIVISLLNSTPKLPNWNERADINADKVINSADLGYVLKNIGQSGASGVWQSTPIQSGPTPQAASGSAYPDSIGAYPTGGPLDETEKGHWLWIPDL